VHYQLQGEKMMILNQSIRRTSLFTAIAIAVLSVAQSSAKAEDSSSGCGIGWQVAPKQSLVSSSARTLVNATFSNTIGMTMGTSGCAKHDIVLKEKEAIHYAEANQGQLMIEMAQGEGENLRGLAAVMGCSSNGTAAFEKSIQQNFGLIFPSSNTSAAEMLNGVRSVIQADQTVALQCGFNG
jgi:hypothetical protein